MKWSELYLNLCFPVDADTDHGATGQFLDAIGAGRLLACDIIVLWGTEDWLACDDFDEALRLPMKLLIRILSIRVGSEGNAAILEIKTEQPLPPGFRESVFEVTYQGDFTEIPKEMLKDGEAPYHLIPEQRRNLL